MNKSYFFSFALIIIVLQVDSKTVDEMLEEVDWLATCDDKVEIEGIHVTLQI